MNSYLTEPSIFRNVATQVFCVNSATHMWKIAISDCLCCEELFNMNINLFIINYSISHEMHWILHWKCKPYYMDMFLCHLKTEKCYVGAEQVCLSYVLHWAPQWRNSSALVLTFVSNKWLWAVSIAFYCPYLNYLELMQFDLPLHLWHCPGHRGFVVSWGSKSTSLWLLWNHNLTNCCGGFLPRPRLGHSPHKVRDKLQL